MAVLLPYYVVSCCDARELLFLSRPGILVPCEFLGHIGGLWIVSTTPTSLWISCSHTSWVVNVKRFICAKLDNQVDYYTATHTSWVVNVKRFICAKLDNQVDYYTATHTSWVVNVKRFICAKLDNQVDYYTATYVPGRTYVKVSVFQSPELSEWSVFQSTELSELAPEGCRILTTQSEFTTQQKLHDSQWLRNMRLWESYRIQVLFTAPGGCEIFTMTGKYEILTIMQNSGFIPGPGGCEIGSDECTWVTEPWLYTGIREPLPT